MASTSTTTSTQVSGPIGPIVLATPMPFANGGESEIFVSREGILSFESAITSATSTYDATVGRLLTPGVVSSVASTQYDLICPNTAPDVATTLWPPSSDTAPITFSPTCSLVVTGTSIVNSKWQLIALWNEVNIVLQFRYDIRSFDNSDLGFAGYVGPGTTSLLLPGGSGTWRSSSNVGVNGLYIYYLPVAPSKTRVASASRTVSPVMTVSDRQEPDGSGWHVIVAVVVPGVRRCDILFFQG